MLSKHFWWDQHLCRVAPKHTFVLVPLTGLRRGAVLQTVCCLRWGPLQARSPRFPGGSIRAACLHSYRGHFRRLLHLKSRACQVSVCVCLFVVSQIACETDFTCIYTSQLQSYFGGWETLSRIRANDEASLLLFFFLLIKSSFYTSGSRTLSEHFYD